MESPVVERQEDATTQSTPPSKDAQASPPKRKNSEATPTENGDGKKKRRKVNHACVYCRRSHMTCDLERPCARCVKRDIGHLCHDEPREPPKRSKCEVGVAEIAPAPENGTPAESKKAHSNSSGGRPFSSPSNGDHVAGPSNGQIAQPSPLTPQLQRHQSGGAPTNNFLQSFDWNNNGIHNQFQDMHHLHPNYMFNTSEVTDEYNLLNDFLSNSLLDDGGMYNGDDAQTLLNDPLMATPTMKLPTSSGSNQAAASTALATAQAQAGEEISRPPSSFPIDNRAREKFYLTAADPAGLSSAEDRLHKLLKAKYDAGMLKPFNYVKGYANFNAYMTKNLSRESQLRIFKQLERFRPKFREAMQSLTDMQLVLVEMWFERSLMEYDRVFASMAIPACCWRRTGEIFRGNTEMADLIRVPLEMLREGKLAIHEIIAEDSLVSYWEKFGAIAFDQSQKAILTSCTLKRPVNPSASNGETQNGDKGAVETVRCCFSVTIRRDTHNIPSLIVGNFLPIVRLPPPR